MSWIKDDDFEKMIKKILKSFGYDLKNNVQEPDLTYWRYGYSLTIGPDGKPVFREFGNTSPNLNPLMEGFTQSLQEPEFLEPLVQVDINNDDNKVRVLVEMPGVIKSVIKVKATESLVKIRAEYESRKYATEVPLEVKMDPDSAQATYNNGILDLSFKLVEAPRDEGVNINID
jgi:HSP20 family protein